MCGIVGILSNLDECVYKLLFGLKQLENRGYDSAGICCINNFGEFIIQKYASENISALSRLEENKCLFENSCIGIGHTRWATHGGKTDLNSHPHISSDNLFIIVHNGIIENYLTLKNMLIHEGYCFKSETDTEVIANLLSYNYKNTIVESNININEKIVSSITKTIQILEGTWGLCIMCTDNTDALYCTRNGSPILVGLSNNYAMAVSEQSAFDKDISKYIILNNYDICTLQKNKDLVTITTIHQYQTKNIQNNFNTISLDAFPYWTLKEIYEQKESVLRSISFGGRLLTDNTVKLGGLEMNTDLLVEIDNLILLGCGTSYNAGLCGLHYFRELCNFNCVYLIDGADFNLIDIPKNGKTALILLSQSGETKDLHRCINIAKKHKLFTIGIINVVDSLIAREVDCGCYLNAGKEVAVASTKSFTSQCILLSMVAIWFSQIHNTNEELRYQFVKDLKLLHNNVSVLLEDLEKKTDKIVGLFHNANSCFVLGKGNCESVAKEGSLKIKEISYIHSEGYSTSSLKHGPFALLCEDFPVILLAPNDEHLSKNLNAYCEIKSRNAPIIVITNNNVEEFSNSNSNIDNVLYIPYNKTYNNILCAIVLQMIAYKLSVSKGINPDMPKNLAKVVTVE